MRCDMVYFFNLHKKYGCVLAVTALYVIMQFFLLLDCSDACAPAIRDCGSVYMTETLKNFSSAAPMARSAMSRFSTSPARAVTTPRTFAATPDDLPALHTRMRRMALGGDSLYGAVNIHAPICMVLRK